MVLPESGPTRSLHSSQSLTRVLASANVVSTPSARAPIPPAMIAAEIGPSGRSGYSTSASRVVSSGCSVTDIVVLLLDGHDLRDEGAQGSGDPGEKERQDEEQHRSLPHAVVTDEIGAIVHDDKRYDRREDRADPSDVLLPFHRKVVPIGRVRIGQELRLGAGRTIFPVPRIDDPRSGYHREPRHEGHCDDADLQPPHALVDAGSGEERRAQAVEPGQAACERSRNSAPRPIPWISPHHSRYVKLIEPRCAEDLSIL